MEFLRRFIGLLLNPRADLQDLSIFDLAEPAEGELPTRRGRLHARDILQNLPLLVGGVIVFALFLLVLFGPLWAPENPYIAGQHIKEPDDAEDGSFLLPPLPPSSDYPLGTDRWGNDLLSLLMHGARNTLIACAFITMVRILLGLLLGGLAGWHEGKPVDQAVMGAVGVATSVPMLISSMILIYALDIRQGLPVFILGLAVIGWTEIAQYIRSEFLVLRKMPYLEGARASGLSGVSIAVRHILPNVLPQLLVIAFLEMGAVMMLLGELGLAGVYIGGGSRISLDFGGFTPQVYRLAEVPEWGAMLADGFRLMRAYPFVVVPPAMAFFIAVFAFNTFGEGLRRLIRHAGFHTGFLLRKRMLVVFAGLSFATVWIINHAGPAPWFADLAKSFNGELAYEHVQTLTGMQGRGAGTPAGMAAVEYIADRFEQYGLEPGGEDGSYLHHFTTRMARPTDQPRLEFRDREGRLVHSLEHQLEFSYSIEGHAGDGEAIAAVTVLGFDTALGQIQPQDFKGIDLRDRIVLLIEGNAPPIFPTEALIRGAEGILWVTLEEQPLLRSQSFFRDPEKDYLRHPRIPMFRLGYKTLEPVFERVGLPLREVFSDLASADQSGPGWFARDLQVQAHMYLSLGEIEPVGVASVIGYVPGSDFDLADEMVVLFTRYDGLGIDPDGTIFPAANNNASGVGALLELARVWQQQNLDARRSVMFVAWGGGEATPIGARAFFEDRNSFRKLPTRNFSANLRPSYMFFIDHVGAGGDRLALPPHASESLQDLLENAASDIGVSVVVEPEGEHLRETVFTESIPWVRVRWESDGPPDWKMDQLNRIQLEKLEAFGETITLALTKLVRQTNFR